MTEEQVNTMEKCRALAREMVMDGSLQGYLAYVGWCNANTRGGCAD